MSLLVLYAAPLLLLSFAACFAALPAALAAFAAFLAVFALAFASAAASFSFFFRSFSASSSSTCTPEVHLGGISFDGRGSNRSTSALAGGRASSPIFRSQRAPFSEVGCEYVLGSNFFLLAVGSSSVAACGYASRMAFTATAPHPRAIANSAGRLPSWNLTPSMTRALQESGCSLHRRTIKGSAAALNAASAAAALEAPFSPRAYCAQSSVST
mmetsp:Transcript_6359/g.11901  ORF Transcript_6359/g.11901 Transcript_6359/m.11901 type:complete len:213 (-) Transcript_6359:530-1168(-)